MKKEVLTKEINDLVKKRNSLSIHDDQHHRIMDEISRKMFIQSML